jgi:hypothetical protein
MSSLACLLLDITRKDPSMSTAQSIIARVSRIKSIGLVAVLAIPLCLHAQGGAPMITNDGGTPGNGHWEIDVVAGGSRSGGEKSFYAPDLDLNYGVGSRMQIKLEVPYLWENGGAGNSWRSGLGNSTLGFKWRFRDDDAHGPGLSMYPHLELHNPGSRAFDRGLVGTAPKLLIPVEITHQFGPLGVDTEVGYNIVSDGTDQTVYGFLLGGRPIQALELMGEIYGTNAVGGNDHTVFANFGTRVHFSPFVGLIASGGHTVAVSSNEPRSWIGYAAVQLTF